MVTKVKLPVNSLCWWMVIVLWLAVYPPKFIGDYNIKICIFVLVYLFFSVCIYVIPQVVPDMRVRMALFTAVCLLFPVVAVYSLSSFSSWCCVAHADFDRLCNLASRTTDILKQNQIPYWVCWGSLLGAVRESEMPYQAVPWEHDFDICVYETDWERIKTAFQSSDQVRFDEEKKIVFDTSYRTTMARAYIDVYKYSPSEVHKEYLETHEGSHDVKRTLKTTIEPLSSIHVCNKEFSAPANPIQAVIDIYGKDYLEPRWPPGLTGLTCRLYQDCEIAQMPVN